MSNINFSTSLGHKLATTVDSTLTLWRGILLPVGCGKRLHQQYFHDALCLYKLDPSFSNHLLPTNDQASGQFEQLLVDKLDWIYGNTINA